VETTQDKKVLSNPVNKKMIYVWSFSSIPLIIGFLILLIVEHSIIGSLICFIFAFLIIFSMWWKQYIVSPRFIELSDESISFKYQYTKQKTIRYNEITVIDLGTIKPTGFLGIPSESIIKIEGKLTSIPVSYNIATTLRDEYYRLFGRYPMTLDEKYQRKKR
jgi:hypothetical protein